MKLLTVDFCGKCSIFSSHVDMSPWQKVPSLTTIMIRFDAVLIMECSFNTLFLTNCFGIKTYFVTFLKNQNAAIHID